MTIPALFFLLLVLSTDIIAQGIPPEEGIEDHYWKEYDGKIPDDALSAGNSSNGTPLYIGQTFFKDDLIPGQIDGAAKTLVYSVRRNHETTTKNFKILCVRNPDHYEWINTKSTNVRFLTMKQLILGGYYNEYPYLIGRTFWNGAVAVGKIYLGDDSKFAFCANKEVHYIKDNFQVLSYNPRSSITVIRKEVKTEREGGSKIYNIYFN